MALYQSLSRSQMVRSSLVVDSTFVTRLSLGLSNPLLTTFLGIDDAYVKVSTSP